MAFAADREPCDLECDLSSWLRSRFGRAPAAATASRCCEEVRTRRQSRAPTRVQQQTDEHRGHRERQQQQRQIRIARHFQDDVGFGVERVVPMVSRPLSRSKPAPTELRSGPSSMMSSHSG
jgi:hypothetical protein